MRISKIIDIYIYTIYMLPGRKVSWMCNDVTEQYINNNEREKKFHQLETMTIVKGRGGRGVLVY